MNFKQPRTTKEVIDVCVDVNANDDRRQETLGCNDPLIEPHLMNRMRSKLLISVSPEMISDALFPALMMRLVLVQYEWR